MSTRSDKDLAQIPPATPDILGSVGSFFSYWPTILLEQLLADATSLYYRSGDYICHINDHTRSMFVITEGKVTVEIPNSPTILTVVAPCYFCESSLVVDEPRKMSLRCSSDVVAGWEVSISAFQKTAANLPRDKMDLLDKWINIRKSSNINK